MLVEGQKKRTVQENSIQEMVSDPEYADNTEWIPIKPGWRQFDRMQ